MAMQASDLYELVRDLPEVWPEGLKYDPAFVEWWMVDKFRYTYHPAPEQVADLILAGVVRKLLTLGSIEGYYGATDLIVVEVEGADELWAQGTGPTLLSAALAAYRKVKP
jgi:hypothetical protein